MRLYQILGVGLIATIVSICLGLFAGWLMDDRDDDYLPEYWEPPEE